MYNCNTSRLRHCCILVAATTAAAAAVVVLSPLVVYGDKQPASQPARQAPAPSLWVLVDKYKLRRITNFILSWSRKLPCVSNTEFKLFECNCESFKTNKQNNCEVMRPISGDWGCVGPTSFELCRLLSRTQTE